MAESDDVPIWRYMDLARYVSLLERGMFFARSDRFTDPWEGTWGGRDLARFREEHGHLSLKDLKEAWETERDRRKTALARTGISCWHESPHESAALWELYLPRGLGVAVKSTTAGLLRGIPGSNRVKAVRLTYEDYGGLELGSDVKSALSFKRQEFQHEREIRFLLDFNGDEIEEMNELSATLQDGETRHFPAGVPQPMWGRAIVGPQRAAVTADPTAIRRAAPDGVHLDSDLKLILDKVVLAPKVNHATRRAVIAVTEAFRLDRKLVIESSVDQLPYDQVSFF
jgi:hypothetical protein